MARPLSARHPARGRTAAARTPRRPEPARTLLAAALAGLLVAVLVPAAAPAAAGAAPAAAGSAPAAAGPGATAAAAVPVAEVTLLTGDRVRVEQRPDGRQAVTVDPAERAGHPPSFELVQDAGETYVVPSDAAPLIPEVLDRELFNVSKLAERGTPNGTPVIVTGVGAAGARLATGPAHGALPAGMTVTATLPSIDATAGTVDPDGTWWRALRATGTGPATARAAAGTGPLARVAKVWLDGLATVSLDRSVPQIGAPQAWAAGLDGSGVTVAVLDSGIDRDHPDLAGRVVAERNFTSEPDARDHHGHGTHVAGTVAGSGAASGGAYTGVAPGARLWNAKVCDRNGDCPTSAVLAGMQWAAEQGADVINLSLGGEPTDGTDPLSQALNALTATYDVLFVVAAGNLGPGAGTVASPAAADAALAVGAVDDESFFAFSSRGPRLGDYAIKPDLRAPGFRITSARAEGTDAGRPAGDYYTELTGTSMAAPHVAGAAAILLQQNPELTAAELKSTLVTTAAPSPAMDVYRQGGGLVDIPAALDAPVRVTPAPLDLGYFPYPQDGTRPVEREVTLTSRSDQAVTLDLSFEVETGDGHAPPASMLAVEPATVTVAPGGTATATVTLDVTTGGYGLYGGYLVTASGGEVASRVPVGFFKEDERYDLTVVGTDAVGADAVGSFEVFDVHDRRTFFRAGNSFTDGVATLRLPPGTYSVMGNVYTYDEQGTLRDVTIAGDPEVVLASDTTVALDARAATPITIETPEHPAAAPTGQVTLGYWRHDDRPGSTNYSRTVLAILEGPEPPRFAAAPTDPVSLGEFELTGRWRLAAPGAGPSPFLYDLVLSEPDRIPTDLHYLADTATLAAVVNRFHGSTADHQLGEVRHSWRPWQRTSLQLVTGVPVGTERTEYVTPDDTLYRQQVRAGGVAGEMFEPDTRYQPGERRDQDWLAQVIRPGPVEGGPYQASVPSTRRGDRLRVRVQEWVDTHGHWGARDSAVDTTAFRLYQDGELVAETLRPQGSFPVSPDPAEYRLELDVARDAPWWTTATRTRTAWTVQSARPPDGTEPVLPLLLVDYRLDLDLFNTAPHPRERRGPGTVDLQVRHQPGADGAAIGGARVWVSYDDGQTWLPRPLRRLGEGRWQVMLDARDPAETTGFASLRVQAWDVAGNQISQDVIRAWQLPPPR